MTADWRDNAACREVDPELFFPTCYDTTERDVINAKNICHTCPVRAHCLTTAQHRERAVGRSSREGIWGGHTPAERYAMRRGRAASDLSAEHGTYQAWLFGCRCAPCEAASNHPIDIRQFHKPVPAGVRHGSRRAWERHGCRCPICATAAAEAMAQDQVGQAA